MEATISKSCEVTILELRCAS